MRLALVVLCLLSVALPAAGADVDPKRLVLPLADAPRGFSLDTRESRTTPNDLYRSAAWVRRLVERSERVTGYRRVFRHGSSRVKVVQSSVDLFRRPAGARMWLARLDAEEQRRNEQRGPIQAYGRASVAIGAGGFAYWSGYPGYYVLIAWRHADVVGIVTSWELGRERTLELVRAQERRMAAALR